MESVDSQTSLDTANTTSQQEVTIEAIYSYGYEVFEDKERFHNWMQHPIRALNFQTPQNLLNVSTGREAVYDTIGRTAHGVYS